MTIKSRPHTQARVIAILDKLHDRCSNHPIARRTELMFLHGGLTLNSKSEFQEFTQTLVVQHERLYARFNEKARKVVEFQLRHGISGIVWEKADPTDKESFRFPTFYPRLRATPADMVFMQEYKRKVIAWAIEQAALHNIKFSCINKDGVFVLLSDSSQIWTLSFCYDWATICLDRDTGGRIELHLILGSGDQETSESTFWFFAGDRSGA